MQLLYQLTFDGQPLNVYGNSLDRYWMEAGPVTRALDYPDVTTAVRSCCLHSGIALDYDAGIEILIDIQNAFRLGCASPSSQALNFCRWLLRDVMPMLQEREQARARAAMDGLPMESS